MMIMKDGAVPCGCNLVVFRKKVLFLVIAMKTSFNLKKYIYLI